MAIPSDPTAPVARRRSLEHWVLLGGSLIATLAIVVLGLWIQPDPRGFGTHEQLGMSPCHFLAFTGFPCPGCGVTTSVALAAHGSFAQSFWNQPFGLLVTVIVPLVALVAVVQHARGRDLGETLRASRPMWWAIGLALAGVGSWIWKIAAMHGGAS